MTGRSIDELAATVRALIEQDQQDISPAWDRRTGFNAERLVTMQGTTVLMSGWRAHREVELRRGLLERLLCEPHADTCTSWRNDPDQWPCECDRDRRVAGYLRLMAQAWQETT